MDYAVSAWTKKTISCRSSMTLRGCEKPKLQTCSDKRVFQCCGEWNLWQWFPRLRRAGDLFKTCRIARLVAVTVRKLKETKPKIKKWGPRLGTRAPKDAFRCLAFF